MATNASPDPSLHTLKFAQKEHGKQRAGIIVVRSRVLYSMYSMVSMFHFPMLTRLLLAYRKYVQYVPFFLRCQRRALIAPEHHTPCEWPRWGVSLAKLVVFLEQSKSAVTEGLTQSE